MKLRNKKTGEIITLEDEGELALLKLIEDSLPGGLRLWEEVKEPLIKDEKIRKVVRAWAEANGIVYARKCGSLNAYTRRLVGFDALATSYTIEFEKHLKLYGDSDKIEKDSYTIAELCGEEE